MNPSFIIIQESKKLVEQYGFYKFTMDQLAKNLKMSKKTIYAHFSSKKELIGTVIDSIVHDDLKKMQDQIDREENYVEKLRSLFHLYHIRILKKEYLNEIKQYMPDQWNKFQCFIENRRNYVRHIYQEGAEKGIFITQLPFHPSPASTEISQPVDLLVFMVTALINQAFETQLTDYDFDINTMLRAGSELTIQMFLVQNNPE